MSGQGFIGNVPPAAQDAEVPGTPDIFFRATKTDSAQTINDSTATTITFNSVDYNRGSGYTPSAFTCPDEALHLFEATIDITFQTAGYCRVYFEVAGVGTIAEDRRIVGGAEQHVFNLSSLMHLAAFRDVIVKVYQVTGNTASVATGITRFNGAQMRVGASS